MITIWFIVVAERFQLGKSNWVFFIWMILSSKKAMIETQDTSVTIKSKMCIKHKEGKSIQQNIALTLNVFKRMFTLGGFTKYEDLL